MAARVVNDGKKYLRLSYSEVSVGTVLVAAVWLFTRSLAVQAQVIDYKHQLDAKADGLAVQVMDARVMEVAREIAIVRKEVVAIGKDLNVLVCRLNPSDLRCSK
jgi:hypothetical protein